MPESEEDPKKVSNNDLRNSQFGGGFINAENVNAERIGGDIFNFFSEQQAIPVGNPARPENQRILLADVKNEVTARLKQSLHNAVLINLRKELQPQLVLRPWDTEIKIGNKPPEPLANTTSILEVFDDSAIAGKLLILGEPGSGKTTTQLELTQVLIQHAEEQPLYPIPVLFNLSSWKDEHQSIVEWFVEQLKSKYGVSKKLSKKWLENNQLLPMLDGLDEVKPAFQESCVKAINQLLQSECRPHYLVVCSRSQEYDNFETKLLLNGAISLKPFTNNQICDYLAAINHTELWQIINSDPNLLEIVKTPLFLGVTVLASEEISIDYWRQMTSTAERLQFLLDTYVRRMLEREINSKAYFKCKPPTARQTRLWLVWLAQQLLVESKTEFLIEEMQPSWLINNVQRRMYTLILGLIGALIGLLIGLALGTALSSMFGYRAIVVSIGSIRIMGLIGIGSGLILGLILGGNKEIKTVETLQISWKKSKMSVRLIMGLSGLLIIGLGGLLKGVGGLLNLGAGGLLMLEMFLPSFHLNAGLNIEQKTSPNQGIWKSAVNFGIIWLIRALGFGLVLGLLSGLNGLLFGLILCPFWVLTGINYGGRACIQHFVLRFTLCRNGYMPWNYARFLNYATECLFLQRVGGRYRFMHKTLQEHFAEMQFEKD